MFHLWPQGRIVRISVFALAALIGLDLGWNGAYANFAGWAQPRTTDAGMALLIQGVTYSVLAMAVMVIGFLAAGPHRRAVQFLIEVEDEMTKVDWPKPGDLWRRTLVVAIAIAIVAFIVFLTDFALIKGLEFIQEG